MPEPNPPPQPESTTVPSDATKRIARDSHRRLVRMLLRNRQKSGSIASVTSHHDESAAEEVVAEVFMVSCEVAVPEPGDTDAGWNVAVAPGGNPLAERITAFGSVPFCAAR